VWGSAPTQGFYPRTPYLTRARNAIYFFDEYSEMIISVIVPTYRRPLELERCLKALEAQTRSIDEAIVIVRDSDTETLDWFKSSSLIKLPMKLVQVSTPGVIAAMNAGLQNATGDIIAFTDDDAAPHGNWLEKIEACYLADPEVGGVGGRDYIYVNGELWKGEKSVVGRLHSIGAVIGNHHLGVGEPREVDVLKGVNMSFRTRAILGEFFDSRMLGSGAQVHFEIEFCLRLKKRGWKLIYDPNLIVDHYFAKRFDEDQRNQFNEVAFFNVVHNETLALMEYMSPMRRLVFLGWSILIGHSSALGLLKLLLFLPREGKLAVKKWQLSLRGRWHGFMTWRKTERVGAEAISIH
jgi:glycosyltransferase involved in cell wall biosynthesis